MALFFLNQMKLFDFHKSLWCGGKTDGLGQVEIRVKTAFLLVFQHICQTSRLWHSGKREDQSNIKQLWWSPKLY